MEFNKEKYLDYHKNFKFLIWILAAFLIVLTISGMVGIFNKIKENKYIGRDVMIRDTFSVSGSAEVYAKPDLGLITFSVKTENRTVANAMLDNSKKMNDIINSLKGLEIEEKDLKTTAFNIYPRYEYERDSGRQTLVGYEIIQSLEVKIRNLDNVGEIIQAATDKGANQVGNLSFVIDNKDEIREQARIEAIQDAKNKAEKIAKELGVNLVGAVSFNEGAQTQSSYDYLEKSALGIGGGGEMSPSIETGENKIEVNVYVVYEIN